MKRSALPLFEGFIETPFEQRVQGLLRDCVETEAMARHCCRARFWQDNGHPRCEQRCQSGSRDDGWTTLSSAGGDRPEK